jgi:PadR family transcriptional regulator, regulatory protein PadR
MERRPSLQTLEVLQLMVQHPTADFYGLELSKAAGIQTGTIYPILRRLEDSGWVESTWESIDPREQGRPRKRLYRLTGLGAREAHRHLARARSILAQPQPARFGEPRGVIA